MDQPPAGDDTGAVGRPGSWIFLSGDPAVVELPEPTKRPARRGVRGRLAVVAGVLGVVALYVWDDLLLAAPVVAVAGWLGPWASFVIFTAVYGAGSFVLAMIAVRSYERYSSGEPSALARFIEAQTTGRRGRIARRLVEGGKVVGFVVSSIVLGGIATTWLIRYAGRTDRIAAIGAASCAVFGVGFAGTYAGVAALVF